MSSCLSFILFEITTLSLFYPVHITSETCTTGDCIFNCNGNDCTDIVCENSADSCTINCGLGKCMGSTFHLEATINTVNCGAYDSCKGANFYCGSPSGHVDECNFILANNAMADKGLIQCSHDIDSCTVQAKTDNDDFKESEFLCQLSSLNSTCTIDCYTSKSCGSGTSEFICSASKCSCTGGGCSELNIELITTTLSPSKSPTNDPTSVPTINPTSNPSNIPTFVPTYHQTTNLQTNYLTNGTKYSTERSSFSNTTGNSQTVPKRADSSSTYLILLCVGIGIVICCCIPFCVVTIQKLKKREETDGITDMIHIGHKKLNSSNTTSVTSGYQFKLKNNDRLAVTGRKKMNVLRDNSSHNSNEYHIDTEHVGLNGNEGNDDENDDTDTEDLRNFINYKVELPQYLEVFIKNGYNDLNMIQQIEDMEELENIGISNKQHQHKIMHSINILKSVITPITPMTPGNDNIAADEFIIGHEEGNDMNVTKPHNLKDNPSHLKSKDSMQLDQIYNDIIKHEDDNDIGEEDVNVTDENDENIDVQQIPILSAETHENNVNAMTNSLKIRV